MKGSCIELLALLSTHSMRYANFTHALFPIMRSIPGRVPELLLYDAQGVEVRWLQHSVFLPATLYVYLYS